MWRRGLTELTVLGAGLPVQAVRTGVDAVSVSSVCDGSHKPKSDADSHWFPIPCEKQTLRAAHLYLCAAFIGLQKGKRCVRFSGLYLRAVVVVCCFVFLGL